MPHSSPLLLLAALCCLGACLGATALSSDGAVKVVILSDRYLGTAVVMNSTCSSAADPAELAFHVITSHEGVQVLPALWQQIAACRTADLTVETVAQASDALRRRGHAPFFATDDFAAAVADTDPRAWAVRTPYRDEKHAAPLNHLRFYLPHLPALDGVERFVFMDDDIVVQRDVVQWQRTYALRPAKAMAAGCQHWRWSPQGFVTSHDTSMLETGYMGAADTACADADAAFAATQADGGFAGGDAKARTKRARLVAKRERATKSCVRAGLMDELRGADVAIRRAAAADDDNDSREALLRRGEAARPHPLERTAFNMGFNLIDAEAWREQRLTQRYEQWVGASVSQALFPPDTLAFGLVLAYLALGDAVQCYDDEVTHLVGLAFVPQGRLEDGYGWTAQRMRDDAFALHFNGANKPWDASTPQCGAEAELAEAAPRSALDIWQHHCGKFCPCSLAASTARSGGRRRLLADAESQNEYTAGNTQTQTETSAAAGPSQVGWCLLFSFLAVQATQQSPLAAPR